MSTALKPTYPTKTNNPSDPDSIRKFFATEANELKVVTEDHADQIEALKTKTVDSPNPYYGKYTTLTLLKTAHPTAEENGWAVIDEGAGISPKMALWDTDAVDWELSGASDSRVFVDTYFDLPQPGVENVMYINKDKDEIYFWYNNRYNLMNAGQYAPQKTSKLTLVASTNNQYQFTIGTKPDNIDLEYNDANWTEGYQYTYNPSTGIVTLINDYAGGLPINAEINGRQYSNELSPKQIVEASTNNQTDFNYSGAPAEIKVMLNDANLYEGKHYTRTYYSSGNSLTLIGPYANGVPSGSILEIRKF